MRKINEGYFMQIQKVKHSAKKMIGGSDIMRKYFKKFNQLDSNLRMIIYAICLLALLKVGEISDSVVLILTTILILFFIVKSVDFFIDTKLANRQKKAEEKTKFIHEGKIYNIEKANLILKIKHPYYSDRTTMFKETKLYTILYQSEKGTYFFYVMNRNFSINIKSLSEDQVKDWLLNNNVEKYKQVFGEIEEA
jgi:hypothetical protein